MRTGVMALGLSAACGVAMVASGCQSTPRMGTFTYTVTVDESVPQAVDVAFIGPKPADEQWAGLSASEFYGRSDLRNVGEVRSLSFPRGSARTRSLKAGDPVWASEWAGSEEVFVFARSLGFASGAQTKIRLSRSSEDYNSGTEIKLLVDESGIRPVTKTKSEEEAAK